jgi:hypothetical protein
MSGPTPAFERGIAKCLAKYVNFTSGGRSRRLQGRRVELWKT